MPPVVSNPSSSYLFFSRGASMASVSFQMFAAVISRRTLKLSCAKSKPFLFIIRQTVISEVWIKELRGCDSENTKAPFPSPMKVLGCEPGHRLRTSNLKRGWNAVMLKMVGKSLCSYILPLCWHHTYCMLFKTYRVSWWGFSLIFLAWGQACKRFCFKNLFSPCEIWSFFTTGSHSSSMHIKSILPTEWLWPSGTIIFGLLSSWPLTLSLPAQWMVSSLKNSIVS